MTSDLVFSVAEAAKAAKVSMPTMYAWVHQKGFPAVRKGRRILIPVDAFKRWLEEEAKKGA